MLDLLQNDRTLRDHWSTISRLQVMMNAQPGVMKITSLNFLALIVVALCCLLSLGARAQISDNFDDGNDGGWTRYDPLAPFGAPATFSFPNGGYRIQAPASPDPVVLGTGRAGS